MPLLEVRKNFAQYSGRYDLIVNRTTFADKGADFFIRAGQDYLDRLVDIESDTARYFADVSTNSWYVLVPRARVIEDVYLSNSQRSKWKLDRLPLDIFRKKDPTLQNTGAPKYYTIGNLRAVPQPLNSIVIDSFGPVTYTTPGYEFLYTGILLNVPAFEALKIEIEGKFYEPYLLDDVSMNRWTEIYPVVLVMAACRELEISYRNTVGVKDWEVAIKAELFGVELDTADQESNFIHEMRG